MKFYEKVVSGQKKPPFYLGNAYPITTKQSMFILFPFNIIVKTALFIWAMIGYIIKRPTYADRLAYKAFQQGVKEGYLEAEKKIATEYFKRTAQYNKKKVLDGLKRKGRSN